MGLAIYIYNYGKEKGLMWQFTKSADAPWQNGCSESLIRLTKRNLMLSIGSNVLTFSELQTIIFEISNLLNERPIGMKSSNPVKMAYLCPNDLILGRASSNVPPGSFEFQLCNHTSTGIQKLWFPVRCQRGRTIMYQALIVFDLSFQVDIYIHYNSRNVHR